MRRRLILALLIAISLVGWAAPLNNIPIRLTQPDGQEINCFASGDEYYNYLHDANGFTIVKGNDGYYRYATRGTRGEVAASSYIVGSVDPASVGLEPYVKISEAEYYARRQEWEKHIKQPQSKNGREINHGLYNNLVVFIRFAGDTYHNTPFSTVEEMFNADGWNDVSLHNFYHHTSYNQLDLWSHFFPQPDGETVLSYEDINPKQYYQPYDPVTNPIGYDDDNRATREFDLLERAIAYIEDMVPDTLDLDYNGDGMVDNVVFVCKGETGEWNSLLWPHRWSIWDREVWLGDLQVFDFNLQLEQGGYFNVSTLCHEMFHSLSAPDLYQYSGNSAGGSPVGSWDLMCSDTEPPQQPSVYLKYKYGHWVDDIPVISDVPNAFGTYEIEANVWEGGRRNGYMIPTSDPNQFIFVEYRDKRNVFEGHIPNSGLLIYHIDTRFDGNAGWNGYDYFNEVYLYRPGGTYNTPGDLDLASFNQKSGRTSFNIGTDPHPFYSNGNICDWPYQITNISDTGDRMSFDFLPYGGEGSAPGPDNFVAHVNSLEHQVELSWDADTNAGYYYVYRDGVEIADVTEPSFIHPYTEADNGYHIYSVLSVDAGLMHVYSAESKAWVILGNYETIDINLISDTPYGTKGGELEVSFDNPLMKTQYFTIYEGTEAKAELHVPANTEVTFVWHSGFDPESEGIRVKASHRNGNEMGDIFGVDNPASGTIATYTASDNGLGLMSPQNLTATVEGPDVQLHWSMPTENNHFTLYRNGRIITPDINGYEILDNSILRSGCYGFQVESVEGTASSWHPENQVHAVVMNYYCEPPRNLTGTHSSNQNELRWEAPEFMGYGLLAYDNNQFEESFGSVSQKWGIKFEPEQLAAFEGRPLAYLEMFDCTAATYTYKIYSGDKANNSNLIHTQEHQMTGSGQWVRFALDENVAYDATQPLWIAVQSTGSNNPIPCCAYVNHDNSCMVISSSTWRPVTYYNFYHSWMLRAYTTQGDMSNDVSYNLYWGDEECSDEQMVLGMEDLTATSMVHNSNDNLRYNVTAVVDGRETDFSNTIYLGPSVTIDETPETNMIAYVINGNIIINNIDNSSILQIIDMTGRIVLTRDGVTRQISTVGMAPGVYILRLVNGSDVKTQKIVLR